MNLSVRLRLTVVVGFVVGAMAALGAVIAPNVVETALVDDILDVEAEYQSIGVAEPIQFEEDPEFDEYLRSVEAAPLHELVGGAEVLDDFIALGGTDELIIAVGRDAFLVVDESGEQNLIRADIGELTQPVIVLDSLTALAVDTFFDLDDSGAFFDFDGIGSLPIGTAVESRMVSGVRTVDGVEYIVVGDVGPVDRTVARVQRVLWLAIPVLVLAAGLLAWLLASRALRPVRSITEQAATISGGSLGSRVPVPNTGDEIATLADTVNAMLDRLEFDDKRRRAFVSDASHELRSPVAVLRSEAEVALRHEGEIGVVELATGVLAESTRMGTMIDDLLALARYDEGLAAPETEVDLDDIVLSEMTRSRRVPIDTSEVSAGRVRGRSDELARMINHLLDNGTRHAVSSCRVGLQTTSESVVLTVEDDGPGIPANQRAAVFERFTRLDEARSRDRGGAGLGLAVVASIAERSGGHVQIDDSALGGARLTVTFVREISLGRRQLTAPRAAT